MRQLSKFAASSLVFLLLAVLIAAPASGQERRTSGKSTKFERTLKKRALRTLRKAREGPARIAAAKALAQLGDATARETLKGEVLRHPKDPFPYAALAWVGVEPYVTNARAAILDPKSPVATITMYAAAFVRRPDKEIRQRLVEVWKDVSIDPNERLWAACLLHEMGDESVRRFIEGYLTDAEPYVVAVAASSLVSSGHKAARKKLTAALNDPKSGHLDMAAMTFGERPDRQLLPVLGKALKRAKDPHDKVWVSWAVLRTLDFKIDGAP